MSGIPAGAGQLLGKRLGKFEIVALLALGGTAEIYLARIGGAAGFEKYVVVKCLHDHLADDAEFVKMFLDEARLAAHLDHSNIVQTMELGQHEGRYYMVMEFLAGLSLAMIVRRAAERLPGGRLPVSLVINVLAQSCAGLHYAHEKAMNGTALNIVHRDISPQNLVISFEGVVKVVDFGIAKAELRETRTRSGTIKGKFAYMSPEQCVANNVDRRTDVFALGVIGHELLTGKRLFKRPSPYETYQAVIECDVKPPSVVEPTLDPELDAVLMRAITKHKEDRYPTAEAFGDALLRYLHQRAIGSSPNDVARFFDAQFAQEIDEHSARMRELIAGRDISVDTGASWGGDEVAEVEAPDAANVAPAVAAELGEASAGSLSMLIDELGVGSRGDDDDEMPAERTRIESNPLEKVNELERMLRSAPNGNAPAVAPPPPPPVEPPAMAPSAPMPMASPAAMPMGGPPAPMPVASPAAMPMGGPPAAMPMGGPPPVPRPMGGAPAAMPMGGPPPAPRPGAIPSVLRPQGPSSSVPVPAPVGAPSPSVPVPAPIGAPPTPAPMPPIVPAAAAGPPKPPSMPHIPSGLIGAPMPPSPLAPDAAPPGIGVGTGQTAPLGAPLNKPPSGRFPDAANLPTMISAADPGIANLVAGPPPAPSPSRVPPPAGAFGNAPTALAPDYPSEPFDNAPTSLAPSYAPRPSPDAFASNQPTALAVPSLPDAGAFANQPTAIAPGAPELVNTQMAPLRPLGHRAEHPTQPPPKLGDPMPAGASPVPGMPSQPGGAYPPPRPAAPSQPPMGYPVMNAEMSAQIAAGGSVFPSERGGGRPEPHHPPSHPPGHSPGYPMHGHDSGHDSGPPLPARDAIGNPLPARDAIGNPLPPHGPGMHGPGTLPPSGMYPPGMHSPGMPNGMHPGPHGYGPPGMDPQRAANMMSPVGAQYPERIDWASMAAAKVRSAPPWLLAILFIAAIGGALLLTIVIARLIS